MVLLYFLENLCSIPVRLFINVMSWLVALGVLGTRKHTEKEASGPGGTRLKQDENRHVTRVL